MPPENWRTYQVKIEPDYSEIKLSAKLRLHFTTGPAAGTGFIFFLQLLSRTGSQIRLFLSSLSPILRLRGYPPGGLSLDP